MDNQIIEREVKTIWIRPDLDIFQQDILGGFCN
jgi:hypothetical protein